MTSLHFSGSNIASGVVMVPRQQGGGRPRPSPLPPEWQGMESYKWPFSASGHPGL